MGTCMGISCSNFKLKLDHDIFAFISVLLKTKTILTFLRKYISKFTIAKLLIPKLGSSSLVMMMQIITSPNP